MIRMRTDVVMLQWARVQPVVRQTLQLVQVYRPPFRHSGTVWCGHVCGVASVYSVLDVWIAYCGTDYSRVYL
jgi:hypothetical protein